MTLVTQSKSGSFCSRELKQYLWSSSPTGLELLSRLQSRPFGSSRRLSAGFRLRLVPSQPEQKSRRHFSDRSRRQFAASPPFRDVGFVTCSGQSGEGPQEPEDGAYHFDPELNSPFGLRAIELPSGQAQLTFQKSDAVFNAESFFTSLDNGSPR